MTRQSNIEHNKCQQSGGKKRHRDNFKRSSAQNKEVNKFYPEMEAWVFKLWCQCRILQAQAKPKAVFLRWSILLGISQRRSKTRITLRWGIINHVKYLLLSCRNWINRAPLLAGEGNGASHGIVGMMDLLACPFSPPAYECNYALK